MPPLPWLSDLLRRLLLMLLDSDEGHVLGDLDEEMDRRLGGRGRIVCELWYAMEALSLMTAVVRARLETARWNQEVMMTATGLGRDFRHAVRGLAREPGTALAIGTTLALAVGSTTAIVAVADAAFLRRLPYPEAERLARVYSSSRDDPGASFALSPLDVRDLRGYDAVIENVGVWTVGESVHLTGADEPRRLEAPRASASLFRLLGAEPVLGRFFTPDEEVPGRDDAVVLSHGLWAGAFGADPAMVGRTVTLDRTSYRVVGVAPPSGMLPREADAWRALALGPEWYDPGRWGWQFLAAVARLRPGVEPADAAEALTARLAESVPQRVERGQTRLVRTLYDERVGRSGPGLVLLLGAVGLLLVMACANVMNVILARAERRTREFGLRRALGSGAGGLVRLVAAETVVLAGLGGLGGVLLADLGLRSLRAVDLEILAYLGSLRMDPRVVGFALMLTAATATACGAAPVLKALRTDPQTLLRDSGQRTGSSRASRRLRDGLVVVQVAVACTLLVAVGLSGSAFLALVDRDPGFRTEGVLTATIELPSEAYSGEEGVTFYRGLMERLRDLPGVASAGGVQQLPLSGRGWSASFDLVDPDPAVTDPDPGGNMRPVAPGYFRTLGIPLLEGRTFTDADDTDAAPVALVDEELARRYWPTTSPVGRQASVGALTSSEAATIIGVVGSVPDESLAAEGNGHLYFPILQRPMPRMTLVLRADTDPLALAPALRRAIREVDPRIPVTELNTLESRVRRSMAAPRAGLFLLGAFGVFGVLLAAVGIYGVLAYTVARRTGEIGTRMALGAAPRTVLASVVHRAMRLWLAGTLLGAAGALLVTILMTRFVQGVEAVSPAPYLLTFPGLGVVAVLAALVPAIRATAVDPGRALRTE